MQGGDRTAPSFADIFPKSQLCTYHAFLVQIPHGFSSSPWKWLEYRPHGNTGWLGQCTSAIYLIQRYEDSSLGFDVFSIVAPFIVTGAAVISLILSFYNFVVTLWYSLEPEKRLVRSRRGATAATKVSSVEMQLHTRVVLQDPVGLITFEVKWWIVYDAQFELRELSTEKRETNIIIVNIS